MKTIYIMLLFWLGLAVAGNAQTLERQVIGSAGGFDIAAVSGASLSYTVGEPVIKTAISTSGALILTQGFQQPDPASNTTGVDSVTVIQNYLVYPNPTSDMLFVEMQSDVAADVVLSVYDITGRKLDFLTTKVNIVGSATQKLSLKNLAPASYILVMSDLQGKELRDFKIEKLN